MRTGFSGSETSEASCSDQDERDEGEVVERISYIAIHASLRVRMGRFRAVVVAALAERSRAPATYFRTVRSDLRKRDVLLGNAHEEGPAPDRTV